MPSLDTLWKFVGVLRKWFETGLPVPEGLLESSIAFAQQFKPDYRPINEFLANVNKIGEREAQSLGLQCREIRPIVQSFTFGPQSAKEAQYGMVGRLPKQGCFLLTGDINAHTQSPLPSYKRSFRRLRRAFVKRNTFPLPGSQPR